MKKGFTLIELLAVIIVLAIVALIATPIIMNVIDDSKESANLRSVEGYAEAVRQNYFNESLGGGTPVIDETFLNNVETSGGEVKCDSVLYNENYQTILYKCTVNNSEKKYCYAGSKHYDCNDQEFLNIFTGNGGEITLDGTPIIEKAKELVYSNDTCKTDGTTYQYMGGCYIKGNPTNNSLWYSGFLWRIMGINADGTVRLITDENVTAIPWGASNTAQNWDDSYAKDWLNNYFYSRLKGNNIIKEETWCSETTTSNSSARTTCSNNLSTETAKVGLITLDEYNLAGGKNSYLNIGQRQRTMTPYNSSRAWAVDEAGNSDSVSNESGLRAVINVNSGVTITGGNGTLGGTWSIQAGPYILNEDKNVEITGKLNEKATSGEYVMFAGRKYRVVDKDSNGNTKLILDGYYEEPSGTIYSMSYGSNNTFSTTTGIGQKLNVDVLNWLTNNSETEKAKLVSNYTWYQNNFNLGYDYKISLNEENPTRSIQATVGLIRVGEMLSSQSSSILTNGYQDTSSYNNANWYWTMTPYTSSSYAWRVGGNGNSFDYSVSYTIGLRAVIVVNSDVTITGGNGTWSNPYQI